MVGEEALESLMAARRQSMLRHQQSISGSADNHPSRSTSASSSKPTAEPAPAPEADAAAQAQTQTQAQTRKQKEVDLVHWGTDEEL